MMPPIRVLLVEDSPTYGELASLLLSASGYVVTLAASAEDAFRVLKDQQPDIVLMDTNLPGMSGLDAVRRLRADPVTLSLPVVGLTGDPGGAERDRQAALDAGFDAYVLKPIDKTAFRALITPLLHSG